MISYHRLGKFYKCSEPDYVFWPLGQKREPHWAKKIDTDTKDYLPTANENGGEVNVFKSWVSGVKLKNWFNDSRFVFKLNDGGREASAYGSFVIKVVPLEGKKDGNDVKMCNLFNLWFDPSVEWIVDSPIIELHELTEMQIRGMKGWKDVDKAILNAEKVDVGNTENNSSTPSSLVINKYKIWQRVGEWEQGKKGKKKIGYWNKIFCGHGNTEVILFEEEIKKEDCPYIDFHIGEYEDRWLRVGLYEKLEGVEKLVNEVVNYNRENNAISSLILFLSKDKALAGRNLLREQITGEVLDSQSIQQMGITNTYLNEFLNQVALYEKLADEIAMTNEYVTGDPLPSKVPVRGQVMSTNAANDSFDDPRDRLGFRWVEVINKWILPSLLKSWNGDETINIPNNERDVMMFNYYFLEQELSDYIVNEWNSGNIPTQGQVDQFKERLLNKWNVEGRKIPNAKGFFKDIKYSIKFNPTGENSNKEQKNSIYQYAIEAEAVNPAIIESPRYRQYLEDNGINTSPLSTEQQNKIAQMNGGGKVPKQGVAQDKILSQLEQ